MAGRGVNAAYTGKGSEKNGTPIKSRVRKAEKEMSHVQVVTGKDGIVRASLLESSERKSRPAHSHRSFQKDGFLNSVGNALRDL